MQSPSWRTGLTGLYAGMKGFELFIAREEGRVRSAGTLYPGHQHASGHMPRRSAYGHELPAIPPTPRDRFGEMKSRSRREG
jgi:hypothetical protein